MSPSTQCSRHYIASIALAPNYLHLSHQPMSDASRLHTSRRACIPPFVVHHMSHHLSVLTSVVTSQIHPPGTIVPASAATVSRTLGAPLPESRQNSLCVVRGINYMCHWIGRLCWFSHGISWVSSHSECFVSLLRSPISRSCCTLALVALPYSTVSLATYRPIAFGSYDIILSDMVRMYGYGERLLCFVYPGLATFVSHQYATSHAQEHYSTPFVVLTFTSSII